MSPLVSSKNIAGKAFKQKGDIFKAKNSYKEAISSYLNALLSDRNNAEI